MGRVYAQAPPSHLFLHHWEKTILRIFRILEKFSKILQVAGENEGSIFFKNLLRIILKFGDMNEGYFFESFYCFTQYLELILNEIEKTFNKT